MIKSASFLVYNAGPCRYIKCFRCVIRVRVRTYRTLQVADYYYFFRACINSAGGGHFARGRGEALGWTARWPLSER